MHSPLQDAHTDASGAVYEVGTMGSEDHCFERSGCPSPTVQDDRHTNDLHTEKQVTSDRYQPLDPWHCDPQTEPYAPRDHAVEHSNSGYEQTVSDEHLQAPAYMQNSPITSSFPQRAKRNVSIQEVTTEEAKPSDVRDAFAPPPAFSRGQWQPQHVYGGQDGTAFHSCSWQQNEYVGHYGHHDPRFHHQHYHHQHYQRQYYGVPEAQTNSSLTEHNPHGDSQTHHSMPSWQDSFRYHGAAQWPFAPHHPDDASQAAPYHAPSHQSGYYEYDRHISARHKSAHSGHQDAANRVDGGQVISTSHVSAQRSSHSQEKPKETKQKKSRDPNKPKRPLSGYNLFFKEERVRMIAELETPQDGKPESGGEMTTEDEQPARKKQKLTGVGFKPMAQRVASKWKALDKESLSKYEEMAAEDLQRYRREMKEYNKSGRGGARDLPTLAVSGPADPEKKPNSEE